MPNPDAVRKLQRWERLDGRLANLRARVHSVPNVGPMSPAEDALLDCIAELVTIVGDVARSVQDPS